MVNYLTRHNIITNSQSGFTQGDSTTYQLLGIYDDFCSALDRNVTTQAIFFDISKAFDKVWHRGLLHKLFNLGIRGSLFAWFTSYLTNRKQAVVIKGSTSNFGSIKAGVPQGSVLGPILFLIYINDIATEITSETKLFADDTSMYLSIDNDDRRGQILNADLQKISHWAKNWKVTFNQTKTDLLDITRRTTALTNQLYFENSLLIPCESHKHLGITLQPDCKWEGHINDILSRCLNLTSCLRSFKYRLNRKTLDIMYRSFILPVLDYGDVIYNNCTDLLSIKLEEIQLDALRTISGSVRGTSHVKLYQETGFVALKERRKRHKMLLFFKFVNNMLPEHINRKFPNLISETNPYHRRRPNDRNIPFSRTELYKNSFFPSTTSDWNNLPEYVQNYTSIGLFKKFLARSDCKVPPYFFVGNRNEQILHCRLRLEMSNLNGDLVKRHLSEFPACRCSAPFENAKHYLLHCPLYSRIRNITVNLLPPCAIDENILLRGEENFSLAFNTYIFLTVHEFIFLSKRFDDS